MKNLLLIFTALLCIYLYLHPRVETRVELTPVAVVAPPTPRPVPAPTPEPKLYYHSALDAPAMGSGGVATGYFSTDPATATGQHLSNPVRGSVAAYNPYYGSYGGTVNNTVIFNNGVVPSTAATRAYSTPFPPALASRPRFAPSVKPLHSSDLARAQKQD